MLLQKDVRQYDDQEAKNLSLRELFHNPRFAARRIMFTAVD